MIAVYVGFSLLGEIRFGTWSGRLDLTEGLFILLLAPAFFEPLRELSAVWHDRAAGEAALKAMDAIAADGLSIQGAVEVAPAVPAVAKAPDIHLENLAFRYAADEPLVLDDFNLDIVAGEHLALLGASGSGKSTLLSLISGLAPCTGGRIVIGGIELADDTAAVLRGSMILHELIDYESLRLIWWLLLGILLIAFAATDGFDLGVGTLLPFVAKTDAERRVAINTIGATWEGNQVWLILAGGAIFAAWPPLYAVSFSGFYLAMFAILFALILRPVGFKYRSKRDSANWRNGWDWALFIGGFVPSLIFGVAVGNVQQGVPFRFADDMIDSDDGKS